MEDYQLIITNVSPTFHIFLKANMYYADLLTAGYYMRLLYVVFPQSRQVMLYNSLPLTKLHLMHVDFFILLDCMEVHLFFKLSIEPHF